MKYLEYNTMKLLGIHGEIVVQEASQIRSLLNPVCHNHLLHGLSEILSRIITGLLHRHHHNELSLFTPPRLLPSPPRFLSLPDHLVQPFLHHRVCNAGDALKPIRTTRALRFLR